MYALRVHEVAAVFSLGESQRQPGKCMSSVKRSEGAEGWSLPEEGEGKKGVRNVFLPLKGCFLSSAVMRLYGGVFCLSYSFSPKSI